MVRFRISTNTVRKANELLISKGAPKKLNGTCNKSITVEYKLGRSVKTRNIKKSDINRAYQKALNEYRKGI